MNFEVCLVEINEILERDDTLYLHDHLPSSVMLKKFSLPDTSDVVEEAELTAA